MKIYFTLGVHNHQPIGNFDHVIERSYQKAYLPFVNSLILHPQIKVTLHYSGALLEWIEGNHPEFFDLIRKLISRKQIEIMSGGFYEPIFPILPDCDKISQIRKLSDFIRKNFDYEPSGLWLTERVWEPHLAKPFAEAGIDYIVVDDTHFILSGLREEDLMGYFYTDELGFKIKIFPINHKMRYLVPFAEPLETLNYLSLMSEKGKGNLVVLADDGEKFGLWPGTYEWVYQEGWLDRFYKMIEDNPWIEMITFTEYIRNNRGSGNIYLPTASYFEMMEWALPADRGLELDEVKKIIYNNPEKDKITPFIKGGFWRNFLSKYPEARDCYMKMLRISSKVNNLMRKSPSCISEKVSLAYQELLKGQCNDAYWHGVFGGLYLPHLRFAIYSHLLRADTLAEEKIHSEDWIDMKYEDLNGDGQDEISVSTPYFDLSINPYVGGCMYELGYRPKKVNLINTLSRRKEAYHQKLVETSPSEIQESNEKVKTIHELSALKESGLDNLLIYDSFRRASLIEHFFSPNIGINSFLRHNEESIISLHNKEFRSEIINVNDDEKKIILAIDANPINGSLLGIQKTLGLNSKTRIINIEYVLKNPGSSIIETNFGIEFNFSLTAGKARDRYYSIPGKKIDDPMFESIGSLDNINLINLVDEWLGLRICMRWNKGGNLFRFPIKTVSQSESGFEGMYQSSVLIPHWSIRLNQDENWKETICIEIHEIN